MMNPDEIKLRHSLAQDNPSMSNVPLPRGAYEVPVLNLDPPGGVVKDGPEEEDLVPETSDNLTIPDL